MSNFSIQVQFDPNGLQQFQASGMSLNLSQDVQGGQTVVWVAINPMPQNTISWQEQYSIYVANGPLNSGQVIQQLAHMPAMPGTTYTFNNGVFQPQPGPSGAFGLINGEPSPNPLVGGLALQGNANGMTVDGPITAANLPPLAQVSFSPQNRVQVFASPNRQNGVFMPQVPPSSLTVDLSGNPNQVVHWDDNMGRFVPGPL